MYGRELININSYNKTRELCIKWKKFTRKIIGMPQNPLQHHTRLMLNRDILFSIENRILKFCFLRLSTINKNNNSEICS